MQYQAIFTDNKMNFIYILSSFVMNVINPYLKNLEKYLNLINNTEEISKLFEICLFCGHTLSR
jgi:hypothetical protein